MFAALLISTSVAGQPHITATFNHPTARADGMVAEQIERPASMSSEAFAAQMIEREGLTSWGSHDAISSKPGQKLEWKARHAGNGRSVIVYYTPSKRTVCRIRSTKPGMTTSAYPAVRWCAASLGVSLPAKPAPPVI